MRVLAADDEADVRLLLEIALGMDPAISLTLVDSGRAALMAATSDPYDVILLDGLMPDLGGGETCRRLKAEPGTRAIPVIFLTALTTDADRTPLREAGAHGFITKPFDPFTLADTVRALLSRA